MHWKCSAQWLARSKPPVDGSFHYIKRLLEFLAQRSFSVAIITPCFLKGFKWQKCQPLVSDHLYLEQENGPEVYMFLGLTYLGAREKKSLFTLYYLNGISLSNWEQILFLVSDFKLQPRKFWTSLPVRRSSGRRISDIFFSFVDRENQSTFDVSVWLASSFWLAVRVSAETDTYISLGIKHKFTIFELFALQVQNTF